MLHLSYPPGYIPKSPGHKMRALPWLSGNIDDLTAYLNEAARQHR